ncbi:MAG: LPS-assembly protein LptD [Alphaproteobacteria bacterium]|nr:LPS-assembly protein LptD [Alphaproteobacteria bacterium]
MRLGGLLRSRHAGAALARLTLLLGLCCAAMAAVAQVIAPSGPVLIQADAIVHDQATAIVTATGHVEVSTQTHTLLADQLIWNQRNDRIRAVGNVALLLPDGEVIFADETELTDQFRNGTVSGLRILLADKSRFAASSGTRTDGNLTEMLNAVFTACVTCAGNPSPPAWQLKARRIVHDKAARTVRYEHARFELFGVPLLYTPYFTHPDPTVDRKTGFLAPTYGTNNKLGAMIETPYYFALAPDRDATFSPLFTTREGTVLKGEYRQAFESGRFETRGSITRPRARDGLELAPGRDTRSHVVAVGDFRIDDMFRWGFTGARSSDDTYLRRYEISDDNVLITNAYLEGIKGRNYAAANAWSFQSLREDDDPGQTPFVLPMLNYSLYGPQGAYGQYVLLDANALALQRTEGRDVFRLSGGATWRLPYTSPRGEVYQLSARLRADGYAVDGTRQSADADELVVDGVEARLLPRIALDWRYPLVRPGPNYNFLIEPIAAFIVAPYGGNPRLIPNEDSLAFEFDDTNLFSASRFPGRDRWEGGPRVNYGLKVGTYSSRTAAYAMIGQTIRARDDTFATGSGLERSPSDYVGRIAIQWPNFDLQQRFRMDRGSFSLRRNEIDLTLGPDDAQLAARYVFLSEGVITDELGERAEMNLSSRLGIGRGWSLTGRTRHDLRDDGGLRLGAFGIEYNCDCMRVSLEAVRRLTGDRDAPPSTSISLRVNIRHLG